MTDYKWHGITSDWKEEILAFLSIANKILISFPSNVDFVRTTINPDIQK